MSQTSSSNSKRNKSKRPWYLAASSSDSLFHPIRELTPEELLQHKNFAPIYVEARERLSLFFALQQNYTEWRKFLNQLLNVEFPDGEGTSVELNRLLVNYLNCAHMIKEHFALSFNRRFRKDPAKMNAHKQYVDTLCQKCFAFGFMLDFRNYCQHQGAAIRRYRRTPSPTSVKIQITQDAAALASEKNTWNYCQLPKSGKLELVKLLREFHVRMIQDYSKFITGVFYPELITATEFYGKLTREVSAVVPKGRMGFAYNQRVTPGTTPADPVHISWTWIVVPNELPAELGVIQFRGNL